MSYETVHIDKICRTCLSEEENMRPLFIIHPADGETIRLSEMLMSCASVQVRFFNVSFMISNFLS